MDRRRFLLYGTSALLSASRFNSALADSYQSDPQTPKCSEKYDTSAPTRDGKDSADYAEYLKTRYPDPKVTKITSFEPTYDLLDYRRFLVHHNWKDHPYGKLRVDRAVQLWSVIWSSQEFKDRIEAAPSLNWRYDAGNPEAQDRTITGTELYAKLLSNKRPKIRIQLVTDGSSFGTSESAHSSEYSDVISLQYAYASINATVYQLANTFSHEYTHLKDGGASYDAGRTGESLSMYVSYGIGGLTENMAAGEKLYCYETPLKSS